MSSGAILGEETVCHFRLFHIYIFGKFQQLLIFSENRSHLNIQRYNLGVREAQAHQYKLTQHRGVEKNGFADEMEKSSKLHGLPLNYADKSYFTFKIKCVTFTSDSNFVNLEPIPLCFSSLQC